MSTDSALEMVNPTMKVTINGRTLLYKRLPVKFILAGLKALVRQEHIDDQMLVSESIKDPKAKDRYLVQMTKALPKGDELDQLVEEKGRTAEGNLHISYLVFSESNNITKKELQELSEKDAVEFYTKTGAVQQYAFGLDLVKEETEEKKTIEIVEVPKEAPIVVQATTPTATTTV